MRSTALVAVRMTLRFVENEGFELGNARSLVGARELSRRPTSCSRWPTTSCEPGARSARWSPAPTAAAGWRSSAPARRRARRRSDARAGARRPRRRPREDAPRVERARHGDVLVHAARSSTRSTTERRDGELGDRVRDARARRRARRRGRHRPPLDRYRYGGGPSRGRRRCSEPMAGSLDGPVSRYLNRRFSVPLARAACGRRRCTPNQIPCIALARRLAGAAALIAPGRNIAGGVLVQVSSVDRWRRRRPRAREVDGDALRRPLRQRARPLRRCGDRRGHGRGTPSSTKTGRSRCSSDWPPESAS